jgi:hypothetical protein
MKHRRFFFSDGLCDEVQRDIDRILELATPRNMSMLRLGANVRRGCGRCGQPSRVRKCKPAC